MPDVNEENKLFVCGTGGYAPTKYTLDVSMGRLGWEIWAPSYFGCEKIDGLLAPSKQNL